MSMKTLYDLKDMLCDELDEIGKKGEMSAGDLETVHKLTDTIKNIDKITMLEEGGYSRDEDYSRDGDWSANMRGNYGRGSSYARRGSHYVRGHYSMDVCALAHSKSIWPAQSLPCAPQRIYSRRRLYRLGI